MRVRIGLHIGTAVTTDQSTLAWMSIARHGSARQVMADRFWPPTSRTSSLLGG